VSIFNEVSAPDRHSSANCGALPTITTINPLGPYQCGLSSAILAEGEMLRASGRDLVTAYVADTRWCRMLRRDSNYIAKGWHPTSVFGVIAAAQGRVVHVFPKSVPLAP